MPAAGDAGGFSRRLSCAEIGVGKLGVGGDAEGVREVGADLAGSFERFLSLSFGDVETVSEDAPERCAITLTGSATLGDVGGIERFGGLALCCSMELLGGEKNGKSSSRSSSSSLMPPANFFFLHLLSLGTTDFD